MGKRRRDEPTHDELSGYAETETLFKSNLFRLQTVELLREVAPFSAPLNRLEAALHALRRELTALPAAELSWERRADSSPPKASPAYLEHLVLANTSVRLSWRAPGKVDLVGSYLLRTTTAPELNVDVTIQLPADMLLEKDYLDQRYADKRLLYLTHLAHELTARSATSSSSSAVSSAIPPRCVTLAHMHAHRWPVLEIHLRDSSPPANGSNAASREIGGWTVRLIPCLPEDAFPITKLRPQRCNLRPLGARPSPVYNNIMRLECGGYRRALEVLHGAFAKDGSGALREAAILLKVWLRQRFQRQAGSPSGFQLSLVLVYLLATRVITYAMGSYHVLRLTLTFIGKGGLTKGPLRLPDLPSASGTASGNGQRFGVRRVERGREQEGGEAEQEEQVEEEAAAKEAKQAEAQAEAAIFAGYFPFVLTDAKGIVNYGCGVSKGALKELAAHASLSLASLDAAAVSDAASFAALFTDAHSLCASYDALLTVTLPSEDALPPSAAGAIPLPAVSANDPTEGEHGAGPAAIEELLGLGLGGYGTDDGRATFSRAWLEPLRSWEPLAAVPPTNRTVHVGLHLDAGKALALVDRGPSPTEPSKVAPWRALWGEASEARRFKDGAIVHAVVWDAPPASRHTLALYAARYLLHRHIGVRPSEVACTLGGFDELLEAPSGMGLSHTSGPSLTKAFEQLSNAIRGLEGVPLAILAVNVTSAAFADLEPFPPMPARPGAPPPLGSPRLCFAIQFESSGKWPDDSEALRALKTAFYLRLAALLEEQKQIMCEVRTDALLAQMGGYTFVGTIHHETSRQAAAAERGRAAAHAPASHSEALTQLEEAAVSPAPEMTFSSSSEPSTKPDAATIATDRSRSATMRAVFEPALSDFDVLLELAASKVPTASLARGKSAAGGKAAKFANLHHGEIGRGLGDDPVGQLVRTMRSRYAEIALFLYDGLGGRVIGLKWKPAAFLPNALKANSSQHRLLISTGQTGANASGASDSVASWALPNVADMLAEMVEMGGGLVKQAVLPRNSQALLRELCGL